MIFGHDLNNLIALGREHWEEYLPAKFRELTDEGTLDQALLAAASLTRKEMDDLIAGGASTHEAWEQCREHHLILPEEQTDDQEEIESPAFETLVETNKLKDRLDREDQ